MGAITKDLYESFKMKPPAVWNSGTYSNRLFLFNNHGLVFGHTKNQLKAFSEGTNIEIIFID